MFDIDPDKPDVPALARILSGMGILYLLASAMAAMLSFAKYEWVNDVYAMAGALAAFLFALVFAGQAKILELLAVVAARSKSRFALDALAKSSATGAAASLLAPGAAKPGLITQPVKERVIHVPDAQAREQGFKVR